MYTMVWSQWILANIYTYVITHTSQDIELFYYPKKFPYALLQSISQPYPLPQTTTDLYSVTKE